MLKKGATIAGHFPGEWIPHQHTRWRCLPYKGYIIYAEKIHGHARVRFSLPAHQLLF